MRKLMLFALFIFKHGDCVSVTVKLAALDAHEACRSCCGGTIILCRMALVS